MIRLNVANPFDKTISLPFNFRLAAAEGFGEEPNKKLKRKWFYRTARRVERGESGAVKVEGINTERS